MLARDYRALARQRLAGHWGIMIAISLIYALITGALSYTGIGLLILGGPLMLGLLAAHLNLMRVGDARVEDLFDGFKHPLGTSIATYLLYSVYIFLWSLLFVIPGIVKTYSYAMTFYILRDNPGMSANDAITLSRQMMDGNKSRLFCLHISFIGWAILSLFTCGIGYFFLMPYMQASQTAFYESLKNGVFGQSRDAQDDSGNATYWA